jgi:hypothetical protein
MESLVVLKDLLKKAVPYHLDQLRFIDLKLTANVTGELIKTLMPKNQLRVLALVKLQLTENQF